MAFLPTSLDVNGVTAVLKFICGTLVEVLFNGQIYTN
ncbi:hypothetical protein VIBRN418_03021 [Vibrio sp. N418]|uniref:Uncharacterized protein n=2 Tax=Vibrio scophthalmi TaxID=45658 RepID=A0A1C7FCF3_9VIBR|nr:hypothetical protein VSVS05_02572 [Vibrio scophthalmi]EGU33208.1 hypothetical protein VIBRN418_03021 [Vibrio sp. N418]EGU39814.1 hypothetical protein VIS19158_15841 [Vibrio scophthalmi LMG 19158]ODS09984.1 hypothetical protein VSF3289_00222 [Vibrio scophthalmi]